MKITMDQVIQHVPCCCVPVQAALYQLILPQLFLPIPPQLNAPFSLYCKSVIDVRSTPLLYMHDISLKRNNGLSSRRRTFDFLILAVISSHFSLFYPYHTSYRSADQDLSSDEIGWPAGCSRRFRYRPEQHSGGAGRHSQGKPDQQQFSYRPLCTE